MEHASAVAVPTGSRVPARVLRLASDERLVALVRGGDEAAFEALYDRHHAALLSFCRHMLGTREEAEDALQHTFLAAYRSLLGSVKPIELRPWLFAIARNRCVSLLRMRRPHVALELVEPTVDGLSATVERREDVRELLADLARLPEDQRVALLLSELGALDHAGVASVLGCPREKVKALVFQARSSLTASREARTTPCEQIRMELATASGAALRRGPLRRHLRACAGCRSFKAEVATQRGLLALALPVLPSAALKANVLAGLGCSHGTGAAAGGATAATLGSGAGTTLAGASPVTSGGLLGTVVSTGAAKVALTIAVAGAMAGGGAVVADQTEAPARLADTTPAQGQPGGDARPAGAPTGGTRHPGSAIAPSLGAGGAATGAQTALDAFGGTPRPGAGATGAKRSAAAGAHPAHPTHPAHPAQSTNQWHPAHPSHPGGQGGTPATPSRGAQPPGQAKRGAAGGTAHGNGKGDGHGKGSANPSGSPPAATRHASGRGQAPSTPTTPAGDGHAAPATPSRGATPPGHSG